MWQVFRRDFGGPFDYDGSGFHVVPILSLVASVSNFIIIATLLIAPIMHPKTFISTVAIEAPCIYLVSFMWVASGAYAEISIASGTNCYPAPSPGSYCSEHKVLEGISFINWIQLMLYANTLMTVATICHVRKHPVWLRRVTELPRFSAPALTFGPRPDIEDSVFITKSNESRPLVLGGPSQPVDSRSPHQFRSRIAFPPHPPARPGVRLSNSSSPPIPLSDSTVSLVPTVATQSDAATTQNTTSYPRPDMGHLTTGEPPTYSGPGSTYELITV